jgi:hypothetical protein
LRLRTLLGLDLPQETRFFLVLGGFGLAIGVVYWFVAYEVAGTALLIGFGLATGIVGVVLTIDPAATRVRRAAQERRERPAPDLDTADVPGGGTGGIDRPFLDESGRLPGESLAPFALGLGLAMAATAVIFGLATLVAGVVPLAWGAWRWLRGAGDEWSATARTASADVPTAAGPDDEAPRTGGRARPGAA